MLLLPSSLEDMCRGPVQEVMPYLIRRAQENSAVLGIVPKEKSMILAELRRRMLRRQASA